jgi:hypothetical protein
LDKAWYAELGIYQKSSNATKLLTYTSDPEAPGHNGTVPLIGSNPYVRLTYTQEFGPANVMVGAFGLRSKIGDGSGSGQATTYTDRGVDAQYQYISDPNVISAQLRYTSEKISDPANLVYANPSANLHSFYAKAMYVYRAKYGAGLAYWSESGSSDASFASPDNNANFFSCVDPPACSAGSPNTKVWIPAVFWQPLQNVRLTLYQTYFTQFLGARRNYDGFGRKASDNNSTYVYLWMDW